jgi:rare lipoprotein A
VWPMHRFFLAQISLFRATALDWHLAAIVLTALIFAQGCGTMAEPPNGEFSRKGAAPWEFHATDFSGDKPPAPTVSRETAPTAKLPSPPISKLTPPVAENGPPEQPSMTETGVASWYGAKHHGKRTANGEIFNQNQFTAAHPTLPFGTRVKVINLDNGNSVQVRINDRGPYKRGRIIDVSRAAAKALGMVQGGIAMVRIEKVSESEKPNELALQDK